MSEVEQTEIVPWEEPDQKEEKAARHDAFTGARKKLFLKALTKSGCILDACRKVGVTSGTVYRHQRSDPEFMHHCTLALGMAATTVELMAWERGVVGIEEDVIQYGKIVGTRRKRSDSVLRLLLQGSNRRKYGPNPGFSRKHLLEEEEKRNERKLARMGIREPTIEEVRDEVVKRVNAIRRHEERAQLAAGWSRTEDGRMIPPGWVKVAESPPWDYFGEADEGDVADSV